MTVDHFTRANEGTYTVQIHDGKAKTQSSLVLVGDGEAFISLMNQMIVFNKNNLSKGNILEQKQNTESAFHSQCLSDEVLCCL